MFYQLPPVGNPVCLKAKTDLTLPVYLSEKRARFYSSGTAALAAAVKVSIAVTNQQQDGRQAEVILPAYACPDLVSAVVYAGARPVLVDIEKDRPWLGFSQLSAALTVNTVAIVAVDLFGIPERWLQLRELAVQKGILLIEDSAQYFPGGDEKPNWQGDLVVFSFGRGKPVSLLGGGAVSSNRGELLALLPKLHPEVAGFGKKLAFGLKARLYNAMISPYLYWLPQALPFLHLGETRYHALHNIEAMDSVRSELLAANIALYQDNAQPFHRCEMISSMLVSLHKVNDLPRTCRMSGHRRLLRYPILLDTALRDRVYQKLKQAGLGASIMYPTSLPRITGLDHVLDVDQQFPNAENFASQLLTLPTHMRVSDKNIGEIVAILKAL